MEQVTVRSDDGGSARGAGDLSASSRWWSTPPGEEGEVVNVHARAVGYIQRLQRAWSRHDIFDRLHDRLYQNRTLRSYTRALATMDTAGYSIGRIMVTTAIVDTFVSRFSRRRPMPMFVVDDGEWSLKQRAIEFRRFLLGKMMETEVDRLSDIAIGDACRRGSGILYIDESDDDVVVERVHRWELYVDPHETRGGEQSVRQIHRVRRIAREVLCSMYPDMTAKIMAAPASRMRPGESGSEDWTTPAGFYDVNDVVDLYESWHLPSDDDLEDDDPAMDGRRARCLEGCTLSYDRWNEQRFPFAILRRHLRPEGWWGQGDVERLAPIQHDINQIARDLQQNIEVAGKLVLFTSEQNDATPTEKLTGIKPFRIRVRGPIGSVQYHAPTGISPAHQQILDSRIEYAFRFSGVSDWAATARSPLGAGASGVAIDTMEDLQSDRHASFESRYSHWRCDVAQRILDAGRRVAERMRDTKGKDGKRKRYQVTWMDAGQLQRIAWDDVHLEEGTYRLQIEPSSYLPTTRAGKLAALTELVKNGIIPQWAAQGAFEEPDVAHTNRISLAKYHNAERHMEILGDPTKEAPEPLPYHDLELHLAFAVAYYNRAECDRAPDEVLLRYGAYIDTVIEEIKKLKAPAPGAAVIPSPPMPGAEMGAPPMPPGMPMPPMPGGGAMPAPMPPGAMPPGLPQ